MLSNSGVWRDNGNIKFHRSGLYTFGWNNPISGNLSYSKCDHQQKGDIVVPKDFPNFNGIINIKRLEEIDNSLKYTVHDVGFVLHYKCDCGAKHTTFPTHHYEWCSSFTKTT